MGKYSQGSVNSASFLRQQALARQRLITESLTPSRTQTNQTTAKVNNFDLQVDGLRDDVAGLESSVSGFDARIMATESQASSAQSTANIAIANAQELVVNGGFEMGDLTGWTAYHTDGIGVTEVANETHSGNYMLSGNLPTTTYAIEFLSKSFPVVQGRILRCSGWFWNDARATAANISIKFNDGSLSDKTDINSLGDGWKYASADVTVPSGVSSGRFRLAYYHPDSSTVFTRSDDLSVKDITEVKAAQNAANTAQSTANTAVSKANAAQSTANSALSAAGTAQTAAEDANSAATAATTKAEDASSAATQAQATAASANQSATSAQTAANLALANSQELLADPTFIQKWDKWVNRNAANANVFFDHDNGNLTLNPNANAPWYTVLVSTPNLSGTTPVGYDRTYRISCDVRAPWGGTDTIFYVSVATGMNLMIPTSGLSQADYTHFETDITLKANAVLRTDTLIAIWTPGDAGIALSNIHVRDITEAKAAQSAADSAVVSASSAQSDAALALSIVSANAVPFVGSGSSTLGDVLSTSWADDVTVTVPHVQGCDVVTISVSVFGQLLGSGVLSARVMVDGSETGATVGVPSGTLTTYPGSVTSSQASVSLQTFTQLSSVSTNIPVALQLKRDTTGNFSLNENSKIVMQVKADYGRTK